MKVFICTALFMFSLKSHACDCNLKTPADYVNHCEILFVAVLSEADSVTKEPLKPVQIGKFSQIIHIIQGKPKGEYSILNIRTGTSCDSPLMAGYEYVVCKNPGEILKLQPCGFTHQLYVNSEEFFNSFQENNKNPDSEQFTN